MDDNSIMPFGKYQGKKLIQVPAPYLLWLYNKGCWDLGVKKYIQDNLQCLLNEMSKIKRR